MFLGAILYKIDEEKKIFGETPQAVGFYI